MVAARSASLSRLSVPSPGRLTKTSADGGSVDIERNVALFNAVKKARADGVPKANIESALQKVCGDTVLRRPWAPLFDSLI
jgi:transcriptional/translational regulatory protein YebC/TACO1